MCQVLSPPDCGGVARWRRGIGWRRRVRLLKECGVSGVLIGRCNPRCVPPGRPEPSRAVQRQSWRLITAGITSAEAALKVGVSVPVGSRWFRHAGGMPPLSLDKPSGRYLSFEERETIALLHARDTGVRAIARAGV